MKVKVTDQFLWDVLRAASSAEDCLRWLIHPPRSLSDLALSADDPVYQKYYKKLHPRAFANLIYYLKRNNFIKAKNLEGKKGIAITNKGLSKALQAGFQFQDNKKRDDGKWIMLIFDVPKHREKARRLLRSILENLGYKLLQHSVWVCPFDVLDQTERLLQRHSLDTYIRIFLIEEL